MSTEKSPPAAFLDRAGDAFFVNQLTGTGDLGPFLEVNSPLCELLDYTRDEMLGLDPYKIYRPEDRGHLDEALRTAQLKGRHLFETILAGKKRHLFAVEISMRIVNRRQDQIAVSIARDISDRKRAQRRQEIFSRQLRSLATRLQSIREEERALIAREIHDELGQNLTVLKIRLALLCEHTPGMQQQAQPVLTLIDQIVEQVQKISAKLRPGMLDELGLIPAIEWQAQEFKQHTGIDCECRLPSDDIPLENEKATAIFRILQEALTNVARHARATRVSIHFTCAHQCLILEVTDNGIGISQAQIDNFRSLGLLGMKERAMIFGGDLDIHGVSGKGTNLKLSIPLIDQKE